MINSLIPALKCVCLVLPLQKRFIISVSMRNIPLPTMCCPMGLRALQVSAQVWRAGINDPQAVGGSFLMWPQNPIFDPNIPNSSESVSLL